MAGAVAVVKQPALTGPKRRSTFLLSFSLTPASNAPLVASVSASSTRVSRILIDTTGTAIVVASVGYADKSAACWRSETSLSHLAAKFLSERRYWLLAFNGVVPPLARWWRPPSLSRISFHYTHCDFIVSSPYTGRFNKHNALDRSFFQRLLKWLINYGNYSEKLYVNSYFFSCLQCRLTQ